LFLKNRPCSKVSSQQIPWINPFSLSEASTTAAISRATLGFSGFQGFRLAVFAGNFQFVTAFSLTGNTSMSFNVSSI
jgi:hypothetical protein